jgi:membrane protein DedA with SNARE-associated domain
LSISDQLLAALTIYGLPVLFGVTFMNSIGIPVPGAVLLIAAGSFVQLGDLNLGWAVVLGSIGAILGDQIGYGVGRWGGSRLTSRLNARFGDKSRLNQAEALAKKWGGPGIFFSRWLFTSLNTWVNLASGIASYSYRRFLFWDVTGEVIWVGLYVLLGKIFSDRVQALIEMLGSIFWIEIGLIAAVIFGWMLIKSMHNGRK